MPLFQACRAEPSLNSIWVGVGINPFFPAAISFRRLLILPGFSIVALAKNGATHRRAKNGATHRRTVPGPMHERLTSQC